MVKDNQGDREDLETVRKQMDLLTMAEVELMSESKEKLIEKLKAAGAKISDPPEVIKIDDTLTVIAVYKDERLNIAIGSVSDTKKFDTITISEKVVWAYKTDALTRVKRKLLEDKKPKAKYREPQLRLVPEMGGLEKFVGEEPKMEEKEESEKDEDEEGLTLTEGLQKRAIKDLFG